MFVKVSILVPICNVEKFLPKCLDSLIAQTLSNIEIICLNDGSKDNSLAIIKRYAESDSRIVVVDKPNSGYGDTMNRGLDIATGEYIGIVESDDFVDKNMFEKLYDLAKINDADIARGGYYLYWENQSEVIKREEWFHDYDKLFNPNKQRSIYLSDPAIWSAIYKKSFLKEYNIQFLATPGASYQDTSFFFKTNFCARKMIFTNIPFLHYRQDNPGSSVKDTTLEKAILVHREYEEFLNFAKRNSSELQNIKDVVMTKYKRIILWNLLRIAKQDREKYVKIAERDFPLLYDNQGLYQAYFTKMDKMILQSMKTNNYLLLNLLISLRKLRKR